MTSSRRRQDLAIEVRERIRKGVGALVRARRSRGVDMSIVADQILFKHLASGHQEVAVTALASELEGSLRGSVDSGPRRRDFHIGGNDDLQLVLDSVDECREVRRGADTGELRMSGDSHVSFERHMVLYKLSDGRLKCDGTLYPPRAW